MSTYEETIHEPQEEPLVYHINDAPIKDSESWEQSDGTIGFSLHPYLAQGASYITTKKVNSTSTAASLIPKSEVFELQVPSYVVEPETLLVEWADLWNELQQYNFSTVLEAQQFQQSFLKRVSFLFREKLKPALQNLQDQINEGKKNLQPSLNTLWEVASAWKCAEALYLSSPEEPTLAFGIMDWVNSYDPQPSIKDGMEIMTYEVPHQHPEFWSYVFKTALRGLFEQTVSCLDSSSLILESASLKSCIPEIIDIIQAAPHKQKRTHSKFDFEKHWRRWRARVLGMRETVFADEGLNTHYRENLDLLLRVLSGDQDVLRSLSNHWQEYFGALCYLYDPVGCDDVNGASILYEIATAPETGYLPDVTLEFECVCSYLCKKKPLEAVQHAFLLDLGFSVHLTDLLTKSGYLENFVTSKFPVTLREHLILEFGNAVLQSTGNWKVAYSYWKYVPNFGPQRIKESISHVEIKSQDDVQSALQFCAELDLEDERKSILSHWAQLLVQKGEYGEACLHMNKAEDVISLNRLNWNLFEKLLDSKKPLDSLDSTMLHLMSSPMECPAVLATMLAPLATLNQYFSLRENGQISQAISSLVAILKADGLPKKYFFPLLSELSSFISYLFEDEENRVKLMSLNDTYDCIASLEDHRSDDDFDKPQVITLRKQLAHITARLFLLK
ncbi:nucleoporin Nup85 [Schizosaccharomyces japonicus yFS275]|uniref:Nuclear pore complex protein Nup85 n=1 Tax=Schizosaccharomyces japonicus (strain yFS275 / FY16936) TaxID=402676 RepID=B6JVQ6_SCHJY|nr:nucleoporin Nup85 [Schizosaccharomyces japonicus yFS275]EEB05457.1 nucleoporin Nup85 [Schizosaccharomyces japonicus yFS275]